MNAFERLNLLSVARSCGASWEGMEGNVSQRHCARCEKQVHDFRRLTAQEIGQRLRSHSGQRGGICARLTHGPDGALVFQSSAPPESALPSARPLQRAHPAAAYLLTALLGAATASAQSPSGDEPGIDASLQPEERLDALDFPNAPPDAPSLASPDEDPYAEGSGTFEVTMGVIMMPEDPLAVAFSASPLVVLATVGETRPVGDLSGFPAEGGYFEVETELEVEVVLRGAPLRQTLRLRYDAYVAGEEEDGDGADGGDAGDGESTILPEDATVLALLGPSLDESGAPLDAIWKSVREPQILSEEETDAYRGRLEALANLLAASEAAAASNPAGSDDAGSADLDLVEWLVATAEEPLTRGEAVGELVEANLDESQRTRLLAALVATRRFSESDLALYELAQGWAPDEARTWLRDAAGEASWSAAQGGGVPPDTWLLRRAAEELGARELVARIDGAEDDLDALDGSAGPEAEAVARDRLREIAEAFARSEAVPEVPGAAVPAPPVQ